MARQIFFNGPVFDGQGFVENCVVQVSDGEIIGLDTGHDAGHDAGLGAGPVPAGAIDLGGDILAPAFVDLQVNGGGGYMVDGALDAGRLGEMARAHQAQGTGHFLPTLISDTPEATAHVIDVVCRAIQEDMPSVAGLHLEGPHLDRAKKGAHEARHIRSMTDDDMALYLRAADTLPAVMLTLAPENATEAQVTALSKAGIVVSLGHSNCSAETARRYFQAGARAATHLWNAMSPMTSRAPGLTGVVLAADIAAGVIADGIHVHPATLKASWSAQRFLVTDAMAVAGTDATDFTLGARRILRREGRLTLEDGTLAGADLDMLGAVRTAEAAGISLAEALRAATYLPAKLMGLDAGVLRVGARPGLVRIAADLSGIAALNSPR